MREGARWLTMVAVSWVLWGTILPEGDLSLTSVPHWRALGPFPTESACVRAGTTAQEQSPTLRIEHEDADGRRTRVDLAREYRCLPQGKTPPGVVR